MCLDFIGTIARYPAAFVSMFDYTIYMNRLESDVVENLLAYSDTFNYPK